MTSPTDRTADPDPATQQPAWQKAAASGTSGCVETAAAGGMVAVRDSKHTDGPVLRFTPLEWAAFLHGVKNGEFDHLAKHPTQH